MKKFSLLLIFLCIALTKVNAQAARFQVAIYQDGKLLPKDANNTVRLQKAAFQIQIEHRIDEGVLVGATFDADLFRSAIGEADLEVSWYENTGMAEGLFNTDKAIIQSDEAPSYWFYSSKSEHRFDKQPKVVNGRYIGQRTIANFAFLDPYGLVPIAQIQKDLYLVFYEADYDLESETSQVLTPLGVHLSWIQ